MERAHNGNVTARTFVNPRQPQTLYIAQILLYIGAISALLFGASTGIIESLVVEYVVAFFLTIGAALGAYGIANARKWGYRLGVTAAVAPFVVRFEIWRLVSLGEMIGWNPIGLMFDGAILVALFHVESRNYQKIWFE